MPTPTFGSADLSLSAVECRSLADDILQFSLPLANKAILDAIANNAKPTELLRLQKQRNDLLTRFTDLAEDAHQRDIESLSTSVTKTDLHDFAKIIKCATGKAKLAIQRLDDIRAHLLVISQFLTLGTEIASAISTGGIANLKSIIEQIDTMVSQEFSKTLSPDELSRMASELASCLANDSPA